MLQMFFFLYLIIILKKIIWSYIYQRLRSRSRRRTTNPDLSSSQLIFVICFTSFQKRDILVPRRFPWGQRDRGTKNGTVPSKTGRVGTWRIALRPDVQYRIHFVSWKKNIICFKISKAFKQMGHFYISILFS